MDSASKYECKKRIPLGSCPGGILVTLSLHAMTSLQPKSCIICLIVVYTEQGSLCFRFAVGGYDGNSKISTVEIFDPRANSWRIGSPSSIARGYGCAVTADNNLYLIGGVNDAGETLETVSLLVVLLP